MAPSIAVAASPPDFCTMTRAFFMSAAAALRIMPMMT
jgi:hypothetical protein